MGGAGGGGNELPDPSCPHPPAQGLSSPCCLKHGIDACGANLFCAALDGRTVPTCYPELSRLSGESCTEDRQCVHGSCNLEVGACRSGNRESCTPEIGCAPSVNTAGVEFGCFEGQCEAVGEGFAGDRCFEGAHCGSRACVNRRCQPTTCGIGTGDGSCAEDWTDDGCNSCVGAAAFLFCSADVSACGSLHQSLVDCQVGCGDDPRCWNRECAEVMCQLMQCFNQRCPDVGYECF